MEQQKGRNLPRSVDDGVVLLTSLDLPRHTAVVTKQRTHDEAEILVPLLLILPTVHPVDSRKRQIPEKSKEQQKKNDE